MTRIYIRHAPKKYKNGQSSDFKHDPGIIDDSMTSIHQCCAQLIKTYGLPSVIVCSPYLRTRETAIHMKTYLDKYSGLNLPLFCDTSLSEYLGNHLSSKLDVTKETYMYKPPHPEKWKQFNNRVTNHNENMKHLDNVPECVWFITHGLVISLLSQMHNNKIKNISPLSTIVVQASKKASYIQFNQC